MHAMRFNRISRTLGFALLIANLPLLAGNAHAQTYPTRPIRLIVPIAADDTTDVIARGVFNDVGAQLGQPFVPDNRSGASGIIGAGMVRVANIPRTAH